MIWTVIRTLALTEAKLRMRRLSTIAAVLAVAALAWAMMSDPSTGRVMLVVGEARVLYTSSALALGSASLASLVFALGGFYLVRGRIGEDLRSGAGGVIGATPVGNALFLAGRWVGAVAYLGALLVAFLCTMLVLHALRGDGPIHLLPYLQAYGLLLAPMIFFCTSCAILFDSWAPLMGKRGDVLYFFVWVAQMSLASSANGNSGLAPFMLFDFAGIALTVAVFGMHVGTSELGIGAMDFNAALAPVLLPAQLWSAEVLALRLGSAALALLPLLPAVLLFHRYSPDRVRRGHARARRSPLALANGLLRPLAALVQPLFRLAAALPGVAGQVVADVALTLVSAPLAIVAVLAAFGAALVVDAAALGPVMMAAVVAWGILASDISTRDFQAGAEDLGGAVAGGVPRRYLRQLGASVLLGLMFMGAISVRWLLDDP
ncbi:MAG: hypothetical protein ACXW3B_07490, partial [Telluria sp.]